MARRTDFKAASSYTGQKMKGTFDVSYKIDGVRILARDGQLVTRNDKVPPGLAIAMTSGAIEEALYHGDVEVYAGSFFASNGPMQQHDPEPGCLTEDMVYPLASDGDTDYYDRRLHVGTVTNPTDDVVKCMLREALDLGYEGLILRGPNARGVDTWFRVKPHYTADVRITGYFEQLDKNKVPKGVLGGFDTNYGKVTAFCDEDRHDLWVNPQQHVGKLMEVVYRELYDTGSFRYCVKFIHFRDDKDTESFDTKNYGVM